MRYLIDTNVILDIFTHDKNWFGWSNGILEKYCNGSFHVAINSAVYSEVSIGFNSILELDNALDIFNFKYEEIPKDALFVAGKAFLRYKELKGGKGNVLPDFYIGAHAVIGGYTLISRDSARYKTYFPKIKIIHP